jgi:hypothetical protein
LEEKTFGRYTQVSICQTSCRRLTGNLQQQKWKVRNSINVGFIPRQAEGAPIQVSWQYC